MVVRIEGREIGVELKYKTRRLVAESEGEHFALEDHSAQDLGRYDFFRDIERLEHFVLSSPSRSGVALFLTNDSAYWRPPGRPSVGYRQFAMTESRVASGQLVWQEGAGEGTRKNRESPIKLRGTYPIQWKDYSTLQPGSYGQFRYVIVQVNHHGAASFGTRS
jgi:hypothetical protein